MFDLLTYNVINFISNLYLLAYSLLLETKSNLCWSKKCTPNFLFPLITEILLAIIHLLQKA